MSTAPAVPSEVPTSLPENPSPADQPRLAIGVSRRLCPQCAQWFDGTKRKKFCSLKCGRNYRKTHPKRSTAAWDNQPPPQLDTAWLDAVAEAAHERAVIKFMSRVAQKSLRAHLRNSHPDSPSVASPDLLTISDKTCAHGVPDASLCPVCKGQLSPQSQWNALLYAGNFGVQQGDNEDRKVFAELVQILAPYWRPKRNATGNYDPLDTFSRACDALDAADESTTEANRVWLHASVSDLYSGSLRNTARRLGVSHEHVRSMRFQVDAILSKDVEAARRVLGYSDSDWQDFQFQKHVALARAKTWQEAIASDAR